MAWYRQAASHCLNQCLQVLRCHMTSLGNNELTWWRTIIWFIPIHDWNFKHKFERNYMFVNVFINAAIWIDMNYIDLAMMLNYSVILLKLSCTACYLYEIVIIEILAPLIDLDLSVTSILMNVKLLSVRFSVRNTFQWNYSKFNYLHSGKCIWKV